MRTGIFFDGNHAFRYINKEADFNWGRYDYNELISNILKRLSSNLEENELKLVFKGWYQGIAKHYLKTEILKDVSLEHKENVDKLKEAYVRLKKEREHHLSLIQAGLEPVFLELIKDDKGEKGVDVALAVSAINKAHNLNMECAILITNDGDFEPLLHNLRKYGVFTIVIPFILKEYDSVQISARLSRSSDRIIPIEELFQATEIKSYLVQEESEVYF